MAEASISWVQDQFTCSICLDLLKDPVAIPCGHSFCMSCITDCWNQDDEKRVYSCPQCRQTFTPRPALGKNVILAEMVEKLKKTNLQTDGSAPSYAGPEDVECDVCTGRKYKAVKSCLVCLESYCQTHFEHHEGFHSGKRHKVTEATGRLQEMICSQHDRLLEVFCRTEQKCICLMCMIDEHKNHDTVSAAAERTEKQKQFQDNQRKFHQRFEEKNKKLQDLREAVKTHKSSAQTAMKDTEKIFTDLIRSIERRRSEVIKLIGDREMAAVSRAERVLKELEQEIDDLRRRNDEIKQLSHSENHISFLQSFQSFTVPPKSTDNITVSSLLFFDCVGKSVSQLKEKVEDFCKEEIKKISGKVSHIEIVLFNGPKTSVELPKSWKESSVSDLSLDFMAQASSTEQMQQMNKAKAVKQEDCKIPEELDSLQWYVEEALEYEQNYKKERKSQRQRQLQLQRQSRQDFLRRPHQQEQHMKSLQFFSESSESSGPTDNITVSSFISFEEVRKSVTQPKEKWRNSVKRK